MRYLFWIIIVLFLMPAVSLAQAGAPGAVVDLDLDVLRWKNRIFVVFSPSESDPSFRLQKQDLERNAEGALERDLMILDILEYGESRTGNMLLSGRAVEDIRNRLTVRSGPFQVFLIGKDGTVKLRSAEPVPAKDIFGLIDSMPMRRQERDSRRK
jgi:hypothetical protein